MPGAQLFPVAAVSAPATVSVTSSLFPVSTAVVGATVSVTSSLLPVSTAVVGATVSVTSSLFPVSTAAVGATVSVWANENQIALEVFPAGKRVRPLSGWGLPPVPAQLFPITSFYFNPATVQLRPERGWLQPGKERPISIRELMLGFAFKSPYYWLKVPTLVQSFKEIEYFSIKLPAGATSTIPVFRNQRDLLIAKYRVSEADKMTVNSYITDFRATVDINSLRETPFPNFDIADSDQAKTIKALELKWKAQRIHLNLWDSVAPGRWNFLGAESLTNNFGYPYQVVQLLDLLTDNLAYHLGDIAQIGVSIEDVGYGGLAPQDTVVVRGSVSHEVVIVSAV